MKDISRAEHLAWCKQRAIEYCAAGDTSQAFASMTSDMRKHPETENHIALGLGFRLMLGGHLSIVRQMREFIEGFN